MRRAVAARALLAVALSLAGACAAGPDSSLATHVDDWRDEVIYALIVDRFDDGDPSNDWIDGVGPIPGDLARHQGGDWRGVTRRLDYLRGLGVTAVWISPIVRNVDRTDYQDGYHGYWAADFTELNPRFGSLDDLRELVREAHRRDMKIIIDVVTNHTGRLFFYDFDGDGAPGDGELEPSFALDGAYEAPLGWLLDPPGVFRGGAVEQLSAEQFHRRGETSDYSDPSQKELGDFPTGLRDLDTERADVLEAMVDTYVHWVELTDVDGFRLDAVPHVPRAFWAAFADDVRARLAAVGKREFLLLGEVFDPDPQLLASYTDAGGLDAVFDFSLKAEVIDGVILDGAPAASAVGALTSYRDAYPDRPHAGGIGISPWQARVAFADNHDVVRLRGWLDDPYAAELAMTVVFTVDAIPSIYYGTEQELGGGWGNEARQVLWERGFEPDTRMAFHLARLAEVRRASAALRRGGLEVRYASEISGHDRGPDAGLLAYERFDPDSGERALVAIAAHPLDDATARVPTGFAPGTALRDRLHPAGRRWTVAGDGAVELTLPPRSAVILTP